MNVPSLYAPLPPLSQDAPVIIPKPPKLPKLYRVFLQSANRMAGTRDNAQFMVNLPQSANSNPCMLFVKFFAFNDEVNSATTNLDRYCYNVSLGELPMPNTYYSKTQNKTNIVLVNKGRSYTSVPTTDTLGIPLHNKSMFENNVVTISLSSNTITSAEFSTVDWSLVLYIYEL